MGSSAREFSVFESRVRWPSSKIEYGETARAEARGSEERNMRYAGDESKAFRSRFARRVESRLKEA